MNASQLDLVMDLEQQHLFNEIKENKMVKKADNFCSPGKILSKEFCIS